VLAIGYDMGGYKGDFGSGLRQFKIFVYDPNFPGRTMTLMAYPEASQFRYLETDSRGERPRWRTYFVNLNHRAEAPPVAELAPSELVLEIATGGDDLRGGRDNLHVIAFTRDGRELRFNTVNNGRRWVGNSWETVALPLPAGVTAADIRGIRLETTFGGGIGGDNWNLDRIIIRARGEAGESTLFDKRGEPLFRFTGEERLLDFSFPRP
jgi:hypothetical protein